MPLSAKRQSSPLPKRFPVGTTYVVEGQGGEDGHLRVISRYVVLPGGQRINVSADFGARSPLPRRRKPRHDRKSQRQHKAPPERAKKIIG